MAKQLAWPFAAPERAVREAARRVVARARRALPGGDLAHGVRQLERFIAEVGGGRIEAPRIAPGRVTVPLHARDGERYFLDIRIGSYLAEPPRCGFVDAAGQPAFEAWPAYHPAGPFRPPLFVCTPPTAEFYERHPERTYRHGAGNLENTVATIFAALHDRGYVGRHRPRRREP